MKNAQGDAVRETQGGVGWAPSKTALETFSRSPWFRCDAVAQGCTRGKRAFGQTMQDELVLTSLRGLETAKSTMKYLGGDMFFKKWSMPLIPWSQLPVMKYDDYLKLFAVDQTLDISSRRFGLGGAWKWS